MEIKKVWTLRFSPTGGTATVTDTIAEELAAKLGVALEKIEFTLPAQRAEEYTFGEGDLVVVGSPTYASKMPNKIMPDFKEKLHGNGALAVAAVTYGNRTFDHALAELCSILENNGFHTVGGGAFVSRHSFTELMGGGRPDENDKQQMRDFADSVAEKVQAMTEFPAPVQVPGDPDAPYYRPKGMDGEPVNLLKVKPETDMDVCGGCGTCVEVCPMGSIDPENVANITICIKCHACVRQCPTGAKEFKDPIFLSHREMLETNFAEPKNVNRVFL